MKQNSAAATFQWSLLHPRYWMKWLGVAFLSALNFLPYTVLDRIGKQIGLFALRFYDKHRHAATLNIDWCYPDLSEQEKQQLLREHFIVYAQTLILLPMLWWGNRDKFASRVVFENDNLLDKAIGQGPVIVLSCHSMALNHGGSAVTWKYGAVSMYRRFSNPFDEWLILRSRSRFKNHLVARGSGMRTLIKMTREGHICYHMPDQDLGEEGAVFAPFFNKPKATMVGMEKITRAARATVIPCYPYYLGKGRFAVKFLPALENYPVDNEVENALIINQTIEKLIAIKPAHYLWKMRVFKTDPQGGKNPYKRN